jgi:hypothetical protein
VDGTRRVELNGVKDEESSMHSHGDATGSKEGQAMEWVVDKGLKVCARDDAVVPRVYRDGVISKSEGIFLSRDDFCLVRLSYNPYFSIYFFRQNNIFFSQQISEQYFQL